MNTTARLLDWHEARKTRRALSALSERELSDIGLNRADIEKVAAGGFIR